MSVKCFFIYFYYFLSCPILLYVYNGGVLNSTKEYEMRVLAILTTFLGCLFLYGGFFGHGRLADPVVSALFFTNAGVMFFWTPFIWMMRDD
tara:strand:+ start:443 stop:715 length:273 start_codon:yes stop_codon:yes gene_type:complete